MRKKIDYSRKLAELEKRAKFINGELDNIRQIEGDLGSVLWKKLEQKSSEDYNVIEDKLFEFEKLTDREILILLAERKRIVKTMAVKNYIANKEKFEKELTEIRSQIRGLRDRH